MADVLYVRSHGGGWQPVEYMAELASRMLGGRLMIVDDRGEVHKARKLSAHIPRNRRSSKDLLVIAGNAAQLAYVVRRQQWLPGYRSIGAWVIDSFWTHAFARAARVGHIDQFFITDRDLVDEWSTATQRPTHWAPWGTDTLAVHVSATRRDADLMRLGRQPSAWDDDERTAAAARTLGLVMASRPPVSPDAATNQRTVQEALLHAKFTLAFTNLIEPLGYNSTTHEYLTARWMDALGSGSTVAGVAPKAADYQLWEGATIEIDPFDLHQGLKQLSDACASWTPETSLRQHHLARQTLDWRLRIAEIVTTMGWSPTERLTQDLAELARPPAP